MKVFHGILMSVWIVMVSLYCFCPREELLFTFLTCTLDFLWIRYDYIELMGRKVVPFKFTTMNTFSIIAAIAASLNIVVFGVSAVEGVCNISSLTFALVCVGLMLILTSISHKTVVTPYED